MPKTAATLLGFAIVVVSIGFNTTRYPVVWEMVGPAGQPAGAADTTQPAMPSANTESPAPVAQESPSPLPAAPAAEVQPVPEATDKIVTTAPVLAETVASQAIAAPAEPVANAGQAIEPRKPLVPVLPGAGVNGTASNADAVASIRRLPPVDHGAAGGADRYSAQFFADSLPVYPSTANP